MPIPKWLWDCFWCCPTVCPRDRRGQEEGWMYPSEYREMVARERAAREEARKREELEAAARKQEELAESQEAVAEAEASRQEECVAEPQASCQGECLAEPQAGGASVSGAEDQLVEQAVAASADGPVLSDGEGRLVQQAVAEPPGPPLLGGGALSARSAATHTPRSASPERPARHSAPVSPRTEVSEYFTPALLSTANTSLLTLASLSPYETASEGGNSEAEVDSCRRGGQYFEILTVSTDAAGAGGAARMLCSLFIACGLFAGLQIFSSCLASKLISGALPSPSAARLRDSVKRNRLHCCSQTLRMRRRASGRVQPRSSPRPAAIFRARGRFDALLVASGRTLAVAPLPRSQRLPYCAQNKAHRPKKSTTVIV